MKTQPKIITIDPGVYIGFALWEASKFKRGTLMYPLKYGHIHHKQHEKTFYDFKRMINLQQPILTAYIENSKLMKNSKKGQVAAESGALVKLSQTIGRITQILVDTGCKVELIEVAKWKGTLPKEVCERRIRRLLPRIPEKQSNHAIDAIGIGLFKLGKF
jgi:hypothetical protein